jgi:hypothetical protein
VNRDTEIRVPHDVEITREGGQTKRDKLDPRVSVSMQEQGATLTLFFDPETALRGDSPLLEVRLTPAAGGAFEPWQLIPKLPRRVQYARACLARREGDIESALSAFREEGKTRRGLSDDFYRVVAEEYAALVAEGEPHPIKALAKLKSADKSTVSRWVSAARARGLLDRKDS